MVKPEWGAKRSCPKCGERFYDLGKDDPVVCIECGNQWVSRAGAQVEAADPVRGSDEGEGARGGRYRPGRRGARGLDVDDDEDSPDNDIDLGGDDDLGVPGAARARTRTTELRLAKFGVPPIKGGPSRRSASQGAAISNGYGALAQLGERCNGM